MKTGMRIEVSGWASDWRRTWLAARIAKTTRDMLPLPDGYHPVRFNDGAVLLVHRSGFRVVDNRE